MMPMIDIVITTAGRFDLLEKCLDAVYREARTTSLSVIIIDNGSPMQEKVIHQHLFAYTPTKDPEGNVAWQTKRLPANLGFIQAANEGARMGRAPLIMFLSDDVELQPGVIDAVLKDLDNPQTGIVGIKLVFPPDSTSGIRPANKVQHVGVALNIHADPIHPLIGWPVDHPKTCVTRDDVFAVTGACFTIRRPLFTKAGGWNTMYGKGTYEDIDLCCRIRQMGHKVKLDASVFAYHYAGATAERRNEPFNLGENNARWKTAWMSTGLLVWDEHKYW